MKKFTGKNRLAVIALAVMIGVAGYMSFADTDKDKGSSEDERQTAVMSYEETTDVAEAGESVEINETEDSIGEAVLTSAEAAGSRLAAAKLTREQSRSKSREALMEVIGDEALSDEARNEAADTYVKLSDTIEMETDVETALAAKGYADAIVTISDESVDVSVTSETLTDTERAQIEDIVTRKTGYSIADIAISMLGDK